MKNKNRKPCFNDYRCLQDRILSEKIRTVFRDHPQDYRTALEDIGFVWVDEEQDVEEAEEKEAIPQNINQEFLVAYFCCCIPISDSVLQSFLEERSAESPNYALFRRYFREGNHQLARLIQYGLDRCPTDRDLLHDLAYFHEFNGMFAELIDAYTLACRLEGDPDAFKTLAEDFYFNTVEDGFDALRSLQEEFRETPDKSQLIDALTQEIRLEEEMVDSIDLDRLH